MAFTDKKGWIEASQWVSAAWNRGDSYSSRLWKWCRTYMSDLTTLPRNIYGTWKSSILLTDEDLRDEIQTHLHGIGPYIAAMDIVQFLSTPEMKTRLSNKPISLRTAQCWLCIMGYHWQKEWKGQYSDGHEREDVTRYHQSVFLPAMAEYAKSMRKWDDEGNEEVPTLPPRKMDHFRWVHNSESAKPYAKGDGASLMVADFVSANYGWLRGDDSDACITLKPGKNRDGYFSNEEVLQQATRAMDVLCQKYPNERHVFVFDNARTHAKHAEDTLSALHMPHNPKHWGITVPACDPTGKTLHLPNGKPRTEIKRMADTTFNGQQQTLYFLDDHLMHPGKFKGMVQILKERGHLNINSLHAHCCCRNILFCSDDFINIPCLLMTHCQARGFDVLFLPKFHCKLNFIEQVIEDVKKNSKAALDMVSILSMWWFSNRSLRYMDGYQRGLDGREAAWATRKYHRHRQMPADATREMIWEWMAGWLHYYTSANKREHPCPRPTQGVGEGVEGPPGGQGPLGVHLGGSYNGGTTG
ncbi:hypothetical protein BS47DRAFT_1378395 [Hydnum rufescens UP504]|uniref:Uncharacterized protein n=1 Tax=Hydnum rufescens UP504 TaxID=1448309 RepID=A0A9P6AE11_9AGAM|nr:hypothetical protein BS47DRAFT_1378395 [Hydnum rufescens UP504]